MNRDGAHDATSAKPSGGEIPAPGRPTSLGVAADRADAADLLEILTVVRRHRDRDSGNAYKVAREALWFMWEQRRLPRPLIRGKYPVSYPGRPAHVPCSSSIVLADVRTAPSAGS